MLKPILKTGLGFTTLDGWLIIFSVYLCERARKTQNTTYEHVLLLSFICILQLVVGQKNTQFNQRDSTNKKQGHWIYFGKDRPDSGYPLESKIEEGDYINDRKEGTWIKYHLDGKTPKIIGSYENNRPIGTYMTFNKNGLPKEFGYFVKNSYLYMGRHDEKGILRYFLDSTGKEIYFYPNGQLECVYINNSSAKNPVIYYDSLGNVKQLTTEDRRSFDNSLVMKFKTACHNDSLRFQITYLPDSLTSYKKGNTLNNTEKEIPKLTSEDKLRTGEKQFDPNGLNKIYNLDNEIWIIGEFKDGQLWNGKVYSYDKDGILLRVSKYKNGVYIGQE